MTRILRAGQSAIKWNSRTGQFFHKLPTITYENRPHAPPSSFSVSDSIRKMETSGLFRALPATDGVKQSLLRLIELEQREEEELLQEAGLA